MSEYEERQDDENDVAEDLEVGDEADDVTGGLSRSNPDLGGHFA